MEAIFIREYIGIPYKKGAFILLIYFTLNKGNLIDFEYIYNKHHHTVWGSTEAYSSVNEISLTLTLYREISTNVWSYVWSNTVTDYNTDYCDFPKVNVSVLPGRYKVEGTHTVKHGGRVESNTSITQPITVY